MNILVTGANGQLGHCLRNASVGSRHNYIFTDVGELDITDAAAVEARMEDDKIDVIVNCAAYTNVDLAECHKDTARKLNADAVGILARAAARHGAVLVQISTDYVFGGNLGNTPRCEDEPENPMGAYGRTKLEGEEQARQSGCQLLLIRTAWLYSEYGKNFVKTMMELTRTKPELKVVFDQCGTPTYAQDLANAITAIIDQGVKPGTYHYSNEGVCSWYDFAIAIAEYAGNDGCDIRPCRSDEFPRPAARPPYSVLDKGKIKHAYGLHIPHWTTSLKKCVANLLDKG